MIERLRTRPQFQAVLVGAPVVKTPHFALHRLALGGSPADSALFPAAVPWVGVLLPKRWARRAVTRNAIRRQIYSTASEVSATLAPAAHVVRLRSAFSRDVFVSATSQALKRAVRGELQQLWSQAQARPLPAPARPAG